MAAANAQPKDLIRNARLVIETEDGSSSNMWPRASAILGRQALEKALEQLWQDVAPGVEQASMRAQLLCLSRFVGDDRASEARYAWHRLSAACHHHPYELPPIAKELKGWLTDVEKLVACFAAEARERQ